MLGRKRDTSDIMWKIKHIFDGEYGCEGRLPGQLPQVSVTLTDEKGNERYVSAEDAVAVAFGKRPLAVRRGGSIPIISTFEQVLGIKTVLMGFGLEQNAIHSPNESCTLDFFYKGIESVAEFYKRFN